MKKVVIIGAGYGGMALANLLGKAGMSVDVYEKNDVTGGRISAIKQDDFTFDIGPSWYLMPEVFEQYYSLFGLSAAERLELIRLKPAYKVFFDEAPPLIITGNTEADAPVFEAVESGAGERLHRYMQSSDRTYTLAVNGLLYSNFTRPLGLITPQFMKGTPGATWRLTQSLDTYVRRRFKDQRLQQVLEYHSVFLGSSPFQAPAIYSLMSHLDFSTGVFYPKKGMLSLPADMQRLGEAYGVTYHTTRAVASIDVKEGAASGVTLEDGTVVEADIVISNADLAFTETTLLAPQYQTYPEQYWTKRQPSPSALLISLGVRGELPELSHHSLFLTSRWRENFTAIYETRDLPDQASFYVCAPTKTDPSLAPKGHENVFILVPLPAGVDLTQEQSEKLTNRIIDELANKAGIADFTERIVSKHVFAPQDFKHRYNAWDNNAFGGESHLLKQSVLFRTNNQSKKVRGLYYVGAGTTPGVGVPMCLISAELVYKRIMGITHHRPLTPEEVRTV